MLDEAQVTTIAISLLFLLLGLFIVILYQKNRLFQLKKESDATLKQQNINELHAIESTMRSAFHFAEVKITPIIYERKDYTKSINHLVANVVDLQERREDNRRHYIVYLDVGRVTGVVSIITGKYLKSHIESYLRRVNFTFKFKNNNEM